MGLCKKMLIDIQFLIVKIHPSYKFFGAYSSQVVTAAAGIEKFLTFLQKIIPHFETFFIFYQPITPLECCHVFVNKKTHL